MTVTVLAPGPVTTDFWEISGWEVAGGQSFERAVPRPAWVTAEEAASAGVKGLEAGRRVVIPGLPIRAAMLATPVPAPRGQAARHRVGDAAALSAPALT